ncbi:hypothetical protein FSP39_017990 [Pinctada imbricata]|uniref:N(4)-(Beta-N-acetylglucosaminyl)-L-asparaginase n=1 Tax=Pinctada imbricata TaxID=66713 RepID=A0AA89BZP2_PINIB|nr:hypothetical protein FSP39_017990 [Pinctada imbricata]
MSRYLILALIYMLFLQQLASCYKFPIVINTWPFTNATKAAFHTIYDERKSYLDAIVAGCERCEIDECDGTVGPEGDPDESGEVTLDAMIMDGKTMDVGSVGCLRNISSAIRVARAVMDYTDHTLLVGELATNFAVEMGFKRTDISTGRAQAVYQKWLKNHCQPNYRQNVSPDPRSNCGPYSPNPTNWFQTNPHHESRSNKGIGPTNHDTIGMVVIDTQGNIASGTTTNGLGNKIPGRVGDSPVVGAGSYAENGKGGAAGTGDGDIMMRFLPAYSAVQMMGRGVDPMTAASQVLKPITAHYPKFAGAIITINSQGIFDISGRVRNTPLALPASGAQDARYSLRLCLLSLFTIWTND